MTSTFDFAAPSCELNLSVPGQRTSRAARTETITAELAECEDPVRESELRDELICLHIDVATTIATRYHSRGVATDDLHQVACLALTKAARRFDASAGHAFMAFAVPTIRGEVRRYFRDHGWAIRPPRRIQSLQYRVWEAESELAHRRGRPATPRELAEHLDAPLDDVLETLDARQCFTPASLDRPVGEHGNTSMGDLLPTADTTHESVEARTALGPAVRELGPRDRYILRLRFFDGLSQSEIADDLGISQVQVSRLLARIYRDLRRHLGPVEPTSP